MTEAEQPEATDSGKVAAFFDLDGTLVTTNSAWLWIRRERRLKRISRLQVLRGFGYLALYYFGVVNIERAMGQALRTVVGEEEDNLRQWTEDWFDVEVRPMAAKGGPPFLEAHRQVGHELVLLSSTSPYAAGAAVRTFGLDGAISSVFELKDGKFTGGFESPLCYGEGKVIRAEAYAKTHGIDLDGSYFYTDSSTDIPMLERVEFPRVVHPDPRLRRHALAKGWPILEWKDSESPEGRALLERIVDAPCP